MSRPWHESHYKLLALADWLEEEGRISTAKEAISVFAKPWHFDSEYREMVAHQAALEASEQAA
jgi:hypothetical protein